MVMVLRMVTVWLCLGTKTIYLGLRTTLWFGLKSSNFTSGYACDAEHDVAQFVL